MKGLGRGAYLALVYAFLYLPIAVLIVYSFNDARYSLSWQGFTWGWYESLSQNDDLIDVALNSVIVALLSATLATIISTLGAVALYRYRFSGRNVLNGLIFVLIMSPEIVMGISLLLLFVTMGLELGFTTVLLSHTTFSIPFVVVTVMSRLSGFDKFLIEAAQDLGATEFQTFRKVILPLLIPAVVAGWLLSFTLSMDDVIISFFVTGPDFEVLPLKVYSMVRLGVKPEINALSTVMFALTLVIVLIAQSLLKERK